jgi:hypothetical protein
MIRCGLSGPLACRSGLAALALTLLVPASVRAQEEEQPGAPKKAIELRIEGLQKELAKVAADEKETVEVQRLLAEIEQKKAEVQVLKARLAALKDRAKQTSPLQRVVVGPGAPGVRLQVPMHLVAPGQPLAIPMTGAPQAGMMFELVHGEKGTLIFRPVTPQPGVRVEERGRFAPQPMLVPGSGTAAPHALRPGSNVEQRLDAIARELEQLRREIRGGAAPERRPVPATPPKPRPPDDDQEEEARSRLRQQQDELERALNRLREAVEKEKKPRD